MDHLHPRTNAGRVSRCSEARKLLANYIWEETHMRVNPIDITSSYPNRGAWRVSTVDEDWPRITLKSITVRNFDLIKKKLEERQIDIVIVDCISPETDGRTDPEPELDPDDLDTVIKRVYPNLPIGLSRCVHMPPEPESSQFGHCCSHSPLLVSDNENENADEFEGASPIPLPVARQALKKRDILRDVISQNKFLEEQLNRVKIENERLKWENAVFQVHARAYFPMDISMHQDEYPTLEAPEDLSTEQWFNFSQPPVDDHPIPREVSG